MFALADTADWLPILWTVALPCLAALLWGLAAQGRRPGHAAPTSPKFASKASAGGGGHAARELDGPAFWPLTGLFRLGWDLDVLRFIWDQGDTDAVYRMSQRYGPLFAIPTMLHCTMLCTAEAIRDAFVDQPNVFLDRHNILLTTLLRNNRDASVDKNLRGGLIAADGPMWATHRKLFLKVLKKHGMGRAEMARRLEYEASVLVERLKSFAKSNKAFVLQEEVSLFLVNPITQFTFGRRMGEDEAMYYYHCCMLFYNYSMVANEIQAIGPLAIKLPGILGRYAQCEKGYNRMAAFAREVIQEKRAKFDPEVVEDLVDHYLHLQHEGKGDSFQEYIFNDGQIEAMIMDIVFLSGATTGAATIQLGMAHLLRNPNVMERVQQEIDDLLGSARPVRWEDRVNLPYTEAVCHEMERLVSVSPYGVPRTSSEEARVLGYRVPAGSVVWGYTGVVHIDPAAWPDPKEFRPERHLSPDGKTCVVDHAHLMPFSVGGRSCPADQYGRMEIFLFVAILLQNFKFKVPAGEPLPTLRTITLVGRQQTVDGRRNAPSRCCVEMRS